MTTVISQTDFPGLTLRGRGKVRDIYELGDKLLIVATDRLSAFDVVLPTPIPDKGKVLTQISLYWFETLAAHRSQSRALRHRISAARWLPTPHRCKAAAMVVKQDRAAAGRMCGARIYFRLRLEGLSEDRRDLRDFAAAGPSRIGQAARAHFHAFDQGHDRPRRKYFVRRNRRADRPAASRKNPRHQPDDLPRSFRTRREARDHHRRHQI